MKLLGGSIYEEDPEYGLGIFRRVDVNGNTEYESMDESGFRVWLDEELESWVVGRLIAFQKTMTSCTFDVHVVLRGGSRDRSWGAELWSIFSHKNHKIVHTQNTKNGTNFYITSSKLTVFWEKLPKKRKKSLIFSRTPCKMLQICKFAPEAQENSAIFS